MIYHTFLKDCECDTAGVLLHEGIICCRWCRTPYAKGGQMNYEQDHFINNVLQDAHNFRSKVAELKRKSPVYPEIYEENTGTQIWVSTIVPFMHNNNGYLRHHVETIIITPGCGRSEVLLRLATACDLTKKSALPTEHDDII